MNTIQKAASYAFPSVLNIYGMREEQTGMTLRDWFAANASEQDIQDFLPQDRREECAFKKEHGFWPDRRWARYRHADAMIAARMKGGDDE
jgi:hypothetical protein